MPPMQRDALVELANHLRELHHASRPLLLPNAWDVGSAIAVQRAGAAAVATTSSGVAASMGFPDGEQIPVAEMLLMVLRITGAVHVPVTADLEGGYGLSPGILVEEMLRVGAAGLNLEDSDRSGGADALLPVEAQAERIAALRSAAERVGVPIVVNARIDTFLQAGGEASDRLADAIARGRAYLAAGADCVYPIGLGDAAAIRRLVREVDGPVNILLRPGAPSLRQLRRIGVRRISVGGALWRNSMGMVETLAMRLFAGDGAAFLSDGET